jgi:hypothetical protein
MSTALRMRSLFALLVLCLCAGHSALAQMETATLSGVIQDPNGRVVPDVEVTATRIETGTVATTKTNGAGIYFFTGLMPGHYHVMVRKPGFKEIAIKEFELYVQDKLEQNFALEMGSVSETVTVEGNTPLINTQDATVSTVIDRQFAENLPLNGRSFQALIQLTPGVVLTANNGGSNGGSDAGQFSVNGQRASSNYWMVDGVSANIGISTLPTAGNGLGGTLGSSNVFGGTNSLVSVDALQEFRIQTSTYSPEFGRTPGAQISIVTRSGTNQFHGTVFDYLRNDLFDANDWFANSAGLPKPQERQNDFGGTLSGPVLKDRTFFFFSYEGLRLRLPQSVLSSVPDVTARQNAAPTMQPFLNAFPLPNGPDNLATGVAQFNASFSNPGTLDAYSLRIDHKLNDKLSLFGRYNYSPSELDQRGFSGSSLSTVSPTRITTQTGTAGVTWSISPTVTNDLRFNYSSTESSSRFELDNFGGAVPLPSLPFPSPFTAGNGRLILFIVPLGSNGFIQSGISGNNQQRQINIVDSVAVQRGTHGMKFGVDFRRLSPQFRGLTYLQEPLFFSVAQAETGDPGETVLLAKINTNFLFRNLGLFAQDTWRIHPRVTLTYGLRWDFDFAPSSLSGPNFNAVTGFNLSDLSNLALAPVGSSPYKTTYGNLAPRIGLAYQVFSNQDWQTVLRGGFGVFYDLASAEAGNIASGTAFPFGSQSVLLGPPFGGTATFPLSPANAVPPPITPPNATNGQILFAFDPRLQLPYTLQWNVALEQAIGRQQTVTASYIGSVGRRLIQTAFIPSPNQKFGSAELVTNAATADYNAFQLQFQRRLSHGLQALGSYTWSHSIDTASASSLGNFSNGVVSAVNSNVNRGPSDFDIRNAFSIGLSYDLSVPKINALTDAILRGWSTENIIQARSAPPVDVFYDPFTFPQFANGFKANVRPDVVPGNPLYLFGPQFPGGKAFNPGAFTPPPTDANGFPTRQGDIGRNTLRGFGATQWDFAIHRDFTIREQIKLQFRAEMFNVLNHPNFGQPLGDLGNPLFPNPKFGRSTQMLGQSLSGVLGAGSGGFNPLYQIGGPRSIQFALKLFF